MVQVIIPTLMQPFADGQSAVEVPAGSLKAVLGELVRRYPDLGERIFDEEGNVHGHIAFFVDGTEVPTSGLLADVPPGAEVIIVPALSGGSGQSCLDF